MSQLSIPRFHQRHRALHRITAPVAFVFWSTQEEGNGVKLHWRCHASVPERPKTTGLQLASRHQCTCYILLIVTWQCYFFSGKHKEVSRWLPKTRTSRIATENSWEVCKYCTVKQRKKDAIFCLTLLITFLFKEKNWSGKLENGTTKENAVRIQRKSRKGLF